MDEEHTNEQESTDAALQRAALELWQIEETVKHFEREERCVHGLDLPGKVRAIIEDYQRAASNTIRTTKQFLDDVLVYLRALALVAETAGNATTHAEKNARIRGMVELVETAAKRVRETSFDRCTSYWTEPDIFRSDYPTLDFVRRIHELEREREALLKEKGELSAALAMMKAR